MTTPTDEEVKRITPEQSARLHGQLMRACKTEASIQCLGNQPLQEERRCREVPLWMAYRCFYCGFFLCPECAKTHFENAKMNDDMTVIGLRALVEKSEAALAAMTKERDGWTPCEHEVPISPLNANGCYNCVVKDLAAKTEALGVAVEALSKMASQDYLVPRSPESVEAFHALARIKSLEGK